MFLKSVFRANYPKTKLKIFTDSLKILAENIKPLLRESDRCSALVTFFNTISPWHDRCLIPTLINDLQEVNWRGQHDSTIKELRRLQSLFEMCGRNEFGWNRTKPGEVVTEDSVYLGNVFGIWTFTIAQFRETKDCPKDNIWRGGGWECEYLKGKSDFDIVSDYQARPFVQQNGKAIIKVIETFEASTARFRAV